MNAHFNHITYFLKLIRVQSNSHSSISYQYSVTEYTRQIDAPSLYSRVAPGVFFRYQFYPIQINTNYIKTGFFQFYTTLCAISGGVITIASILQSLIKHTVPTSKFD